MSSIDGKYDAVGGVICTSDGVIKTCGGGWRVQTGYVSALAHGRTLASLPSKGEIEPQLAFISGANMLLTRRFIEMAGRMREDYFLYAEEVEWCLRASRLGLRLGYSPEALIEHEQGTATGSVAPHRRRPRLPIYLDTRNRVLTVRDTQPAWLISAGPAILASVTRCAIWRAARCGNSAMPWRAGWQDCAMNAANPAGSPERRRPVRPCAARGGLSMRPRFACPRGRAG